MPSAGRRDRFAALRWLPLDTALREEHSTRSTQPRSTDEIRASVRSDEQDDHARKDEPMKSESTATKGESLWSRLAGLALVVEGCEYDRLHALCAYESERVTTHVRLVGAGSDGLGEDVSPFREDGTTLHETRLSLPLAGEWTLASFCDHLAALELWPEPPEWDMARRFRALGVRVRGARSGAAPGQALAARCARADAPAGAVRELARARRAAVDRTVRRRLARYPGVRFKLDAEATWTSALVEEVAATGAVDTIDFKGQYGLEVDDAEALAAMYDDVLSAFPDAYLEDPHDLPEIAQRCSAEHARACRTTRRSATPRTSARRRWRRAS